MIPVAAALGFLLCGVALPHAGGDFRKLYPATLESSAEPKGYAWVCETSDVWRLSQFSYTDANDLKIELGPSTVAFGRHDTNVLWAAVLPDHPGALTTTLSTDTDGEKVSSVWLRFHPGRVAELFPSKTVAGNGPANARIAARRLAAWKMGSSWHAGNLPMVPTRDAIVLDMETVAGPRRFFGFFNGKMQYVNAFEKRALPAPRPINAKAALGAFDEVWGAFDREYAMFTLRPNADWEALGREYRPRAGRATTHYELAAVLAEMLAHLEDLHISVRAGQEWIPGFARPRPLNANLRAIEPLLGVKPERRGDLSFARTADGIGYVNVFKLSRRDLPDTFDQALAELDDTQALIIDLRFNGGGSEDLATRIAGRFVDRPRVYSLNQYRDGPGHDNLGKRFERIVSPRELKRYDKPVVVLIGRKTMSSAESFALMLAQCPQVTTMGDNTAGSSGNPRRIKLVGDILVNLPRWLDMDPEGNPIDGVGVAPEVAVSAKPDEFRPMRDPVLKAALRRLRAGPKPRP